MSRVGHFGRSPRCDARTVGATRLVFLHKMVWAESTGGSKQQHHHTTFITTTCTDIADTRDSKYLQYVCIRTERSSEAAWP